MTPAPRDVRIALHSQEGGAMKTHRRHPVQAGDVVEIAAHRVGTPARTGEVVAVLGTRGSEHFRVRWEDGHESVLYPGSDASIGPPAGKPEEAG
jgi:hypothetical protein